jgi:putative effector of murein hydrolase LrgA (UPF0299 family)
MKIGIELLNITTKETTSLYANISMLLIPGKVGVVLVNIHNNQGN